MFTVLTFSAVQCISVPQFHSRVDTLPLLSFTCTEPTGTSPLGPPKDAATYRSAGP